MTTAPARWASYFSRETMVSIRAPRAWTGQIISESQFRLFGPVEADHDDYRSTISYQRTDIPGDGIDWLENLATQAGENLVRENPEFQLLGEERFTLSSDALVFARWYEWREQDTGLPFSQLQALILAEDGRLTIVNAATLKPLEDTYRPLFEEILRSTRIIPDEPETSDAAPIIEITTAFFEQEGWPFHRHESEDTLLTKYRGENGQWNCEAWTREEERQLLFYSLCPFDVPEDKRDDVAELLTRANHDLAIGNFDLDYDEGTVRFRTSIDVEDDRISISLVRNLVMANVTMMDLYLPEIREIIDGD